MLGGIALVIAFLALFSGFMYLQQPGMIFFPDRQIETTPQTWGYDYEEVSFTSSDKLSLHGWYIPRKGASKTLLFLHGNAGNISHRGDSVRIFHQLGLNVLIFDYRGYGRSEGKPSEQGIYLDAHAAWQYLMQTRKLNGQDIIIFGRSLGAAVATHLAADVKPAGLILESVFSSARDMADEIFPVASRLMYVRFDFNSEKLVRRVSSPLLVLHSPEDEIIPFRLGQKVFQSANEPKRFFIMKGDHNNGFLLSQPQYEQAIREFLNTCVFRNQCLAM